MTLSFSNISSNTFEEGPYAGLNKKINEMNALNYKQQDQQILQDLIAMNSFDNSFKSS
jgi:hypothetical protein